MVKLFVSVVSTDQAFVREKIARTRANKTSSFLVIT